LTALARDPGGVSAVEFAFLLPVMLTLYFGAVEVSQGIAADRKVTITARTVADLAARVTQVTNAEKDGILSAASAVMAPFSGTNARVRLSQVKIDKNGNPTVDWSDSNNATAYAPRTKGGAVAICSTSKVDCIPAALIPPSNPPPTADTYLIWGESQYSYTPAV